MSTQTAVALRLLVDAFRAEEHAYLAAADAISALCPATNKLVEVHELEAARNRVLATLQVVAEQLRDRGVDAVD